ncbi:putative aliphatic sulfonates-binding protein [Microbacterium sp. C448]|uniref:ABC transporter substrate-binding protein n=1 Tax=Microbacterium sp. C448 TaxID=1177594 RepID=UPI0003DE6B4C|nr:ABC transporter substrate-binding protein [Microbacterium sp. C448]CDK01793.1 putative aliphatic sulfonates-binding protein [Microbacterium sp. C448]
MRTLRNTTAMVAILAVTGILAGCTTGSAGGAEESAAPTVDKVTIDTTSMSGANEIAKVGGFFDDELAELGIAVEYTLLGTSTQMLEGLASRALDFTDIGYVAVATGAAANVPFDIIGAASSGGGDAILVPTGGATSIEDLAGATVATSKGSSAWALLVRALEDAGMSTDDIELIDLAPDEAQNAFLTGQVDAWALWVGTKSDAVNDTNSEELITGEELGLVPGAIVTRTALAESDPVVIDAFLRARQSAVGWLAEDPEAVAEAIAADRNVEVAVATRFLELSAPMNEAVDEELAETYQSIADLFADLGEISSSPDIAARVNNTFIESIAD